MQAIWLSNLLALIPSIVWEYRPVYPAGLEAVLNELFQSHSGATEGFVPQEMHFLASPRLQQHAIELPAAACRWPHNHTQMIQTRKNSSGPCKRHI